MIIEKARELDHLRSEYKIQQQNMIEDVGQQTKEL
jgi:hypothetical protein